MTTKRLRMIGVGCAAIAAVAVCTGSAAAAALPGCASGAAPGQTVFTVGVSASGTPFVSTYVASAPTASGNVGCALQSPSQATTFSVNSPSVGVYPLLPVGLTAPNLPTTVNMLQVGPYLLTVPANPALQVYQIAPGYYVVRSLDSTQNSTVVLPLPGVPPAPNTGPIPSVIH
jgi:hypothetical protein